MSFGSVAADDGVTIEPVVSGAAAAAGAFFQTVERFGDLRDLGRGIGLGAVDAVGDLGELGIGVA